MVRILDEAERRDALTDLHTWIPVKGRDAIQKNFIFSDFNEAFGWMTRIALVAEKMDHHPEWHNVFQNVTVTLSTHKAGGLTSLDVELAKIMDDFAG